MTPLFSRRRRWVLVALAVITAWAWGVRSTTVPHGADVHAWETACAAHTIPCAPGVRP